MRAGKLSWVATGGPCDTLRPMQPSPLTIGLVMIALAVIAPAMSPGALHGGGLPPLATMFASLPLIVGGVAVLLRRRWSFAVAVASGAITAAAGALGLLLGRTLGLPFKPLVVLVVGLYVCFRLFMARAALTPAAPRAGEKRLIADELADPPPADKAGERPRG
jgi:hypothetical protein